MKQGGDRGQFAEYLDLIGVHELRPVICPFDPGVAPAVLSSHLEQIAHLMRSLRISMACWMIADELATRQKVTAARAAGVHTNADGGPYKVALAQGRLAEYLDLCSDVGFDGIESAAGFTIPSVTPRQVMALAAEPALAVEYRSTTWTPSTTCEAASS